MTLPCQTISPLKRAAVDEVGAAISGEVGRCVARASHQASLLESIAAQAFDLTCETFRDDDSDRLLARSHYLKGVVVHALQVVAELQCAVGELGALAAVRAADEVQKSQAKESVERDR